MAVILVCIGVIGAAGFALTGLLRFPIAAGILIFGCAVRVELDRRAKAAQQPLRKDRWAVLLIPLCLIAAAPFLWTPIAMRTSAPWRYRIQRAVLRVYGYAPEWFPEIAGDVQSDFRFEHLATVMQGTGHESLRFVTSPERAAALEAQYAAQAKYQTVLPADRFGYVEIPEESCAAFASEGWDGSGDFWYDSDFWYPDGNADPDAAVYYLDARGNWNHPASSVVIIDSRTGAVEFSQLGYTVLAYGD